jgi:hypothetical protein
MENPKKKTQFLSTRTMKNGQAVWSYIDFGKVLRKRINRNISRNIEFHGLKLGQIERESKVAQKKVITPLKDKFFR